MSSTIPIFETAKTILHRNLDGLSHEDSLKSPAAGGNCINWIVGHMTTTYDDLLASQGQERGWDTATAAPYIRGTQSLSAEQAQPMEEVLAAFDRAHDRVMAWLASLDDAKLAEPAAVSPRNWDKETVGSLLQLLAFHQSYHVGQTGILRRVAGHPGALA